MAAPWCNHTAQSADAWGTLQLRRELRAGGSLARISRTIGENPDWLNTMPVVDCVTAAHVLGDRFTDPLLEAAGARTVGELTSAERTLVVERLEELLRERGDARIERVPVKGPRGGTRPAWRVVREGVPGPLHDRYAAARREAAGGARDGAARRVTGAPPSEFRAYIGGFMGDSYACELGPRGLLYRQADYGYRWGPEEILKPTEEQWLSCLRELRRAGVGRWQGSYEAEGVLDGTGWSLRIASPVISVDAEGSNAYPRAFGRALSIIRRLLDGREFR